MVRLFGLSIHASSGREIREMHEAGGLPVFASWLLRLRPGSPVQLPGGLTPEALNWRMVPAFFLAWEVAEARDGMAGALEAAGLSLSEAIALGSASSPASASEPVAADTEATAYAFAVAGLFACSPSHRSVLLAPSSSQFLGRVAAFAREAADAVDDRDPEMVGAHSFCLSFVASFLRACDPGEAAQLCAALSSAPTSVDHRPDPGAFAGVLVRSLSHVEWAAPRRSLAVAALSELVKADWPSIGISQPGPVVLALAPASARASLRSFCGLALWSVQSCVPPLLAAVVRDSPLPQQVALVQELVGQLARPAVYHQPTTCAADALVASAPALHPKALALAASMLTAVLRGGAAASRLSDSSSSADALGAAASGGGSGGSGGRPGGMSLGLGLRSPPLSASASSSASSDSLASAAAAALAPIDEKGSGAVGERSAAAAVSPLTALALAAGPGPGLVHVLTLVAQVI